MKKIAPGVILILIVICFAVGMYLLFRPDYEFEIKTKIKAEILQSGPTYVSIKYKLGDVLVLDNLGYLNQAYILYIKMRYEREGFMSFDLYVHYSEGWGTTFTYSLPFGSQLCETSLPLVEKLMEHNESIPDFKWLINRKAYSKINSKKGGSL